tara:strand:+ start:1503 stop:1745 length:243 start_codon:yes stop_codon:yes gene_type:complete
MKTIHGITTKNKSQKNNRIVEKKNKPNSRKNSKIFLNKSIKKEKNGLEECFDYNSLCLSYENENERLNDKYQNEKSILFL